MTDRDPKLHVLIVDDEKSPHATAEAECGHLLDVLRLHHASGLDEAKEKLEEHYFQVVFTDLHPDGIDLLRHLSTASPSSRVFIVTKYVTRNGGDVLKLIGGGSDIQGVSDKNDGSATLFSHWLEPIVAERRRRRIDVTGLTGDDGILSAIRAREKRINDDLGRNPLGRTKLRSSDDAILEEVDALLTDIFGGAVGVPGSLRTAVGLRLLRKGFSSSVVVEALPLLPVDGASDESTGSTEGRVEGNRCVLKIGARPEIATEVRRYEQLVRFGVALDFRVELLASSLGDALGVLCYSFAGSKTAELTSLDELLKDAQDGHGRVARDVLARMFDSGTSNWYSVRGQAGSLNTHYSQEHHTTLLACFKSFDKWLTSMANELHLDSKDRERAAREDRNYWRLPIAGGSFLSIPNESLLAEGHLRHEMPGALIHGDLHGGNVLVDCSPVEPMFRFIDYRNAGFAPRLLDFAALQASARLAHAEAAHGDLDAKLRVEDVRNLMETHQEEIRLLAGRSKSSELWAEVTRELRKSSERNFPDVGREEELWTFLSYALSLYRIKLGPHRRLRLLMWLSALTAAVQP
jgi:hypothetical protein